MTEVMLDQKLYTMLDMESQRYASFFGTLEQIQPHLVTRETAVAFYAKSSLNDEVRDNKKQNVTRHSKSRCVHTDDTNALSTY